LTHHQFPNIGGKIRRYPIPKCDNKGGYEILFFIDFAYTATIASRDSAVRKR